jgi:hypothetical protein
VSYTRTLADVADLLDAEARVWVRLAADLEPSGWRLRMLDITTGGAPSGWQPDIDWRYPTALFTSLAPSGETTAQWLRSQDITILGATIPLTLDANAFCERRDSGWKGGAFDPLPWPYEEVRMSSSAPNTATPRDLVASGVPSFITFDTAAAALVGVPITGWNVSGREFLLRRQDRAARFARVRVDAAELTVVLDGEHLGGAVVELAGAQPGPSVELKQRSEATVRFPLLEGLPELGWLLVKRDDRWLDRRFFGSIYGRDHADVEHEVEPTTRLEALVAAGEGSSIEFKAGVPESTEVGRRKVMKSVAAFANGAGGTVLFGVGDGGEIEGLAPTAGAEDSIANLVRSWVHPLPQFALESLPVSGDPTRRVLALVVEQGAQPPYAAGTAAENLVYYVRRGATTFAVMPDEVRALAHLR